MVIEANSVCNEFTLEVLREFDSFSGLGAAGEGEEISDFARLGRRSAGLDCVNNGVDNSGIMFIFLTY